MLTRWGSAVVGGLAGAAAMLVMTCGPVSADPGPTNPPSGGGVSVMPSPTRPGVGIGATNPGSGSNSGTTTGSTTGTGKGKPTDPCVYEPADPQPGPDTPIGAEIVKLGGTAIYEIC